LISICNHMKNKKLSFILGFTSIIGQVLLLRELIAVFYGNETAYAVILASWLFWVSVGSYAASRILKKIKHPQIILSTSFWLISFILPITIFASRCIKQMMQIPIGEIIGILPMCLSSILLLAPLTLLLGAIFTLICQLAENKKEEGHESAEEISSIYLWESVGAIFGGLLFSFILIHFLPAMHTAFVIAGVNIFAVILIYGRNNIIFEPACALIFVIIVALFSGLVSRYDDYSRRLQWKGVDIVAIEDSIYGNIALIKREGQYSLFENGLHSFTTQDDLTSEESVHYALLSHPRPKDILLIGGGVAGGVAEILKYKETKVDYIELDPKVINLSRKYLPKKMTVSLDDKRVNVILGDARHLVKKTRKRYDAIIVALSDPYTALINRYYSWEFFKEAAGTLKPDGVLSLSVSSSENYLNDENRDFLRSINTTLKKHFKEVKSIPGDTNFFIACKKKNVISIDPDVLSARLKKRGIKTKYVREYYLPFKLSEGRMQYINEILQKEGQINTDTHPVGYLFDIVLWSTHFNAGFSHIVKMLRGITFTHLLFVPLVVLIVGWLLKRKSPSLPITLSIITTGFSEIIFQLIVIIAFQTLYGYAYYKIGFIMSSFMIGLAWGSYLAQKIILYQKDRIFLIYKRAQFGIVCYPCLLPVLFIVFRDIFSFAYLTWFFASAFALLPIIAGFLGGLQYPLATYLVSQRQENQKETTARTAGFLYAMDVLGASVGALVTGILLIPLLGINAVSYFCAILNLVVLLLLLNEK